MKKNNKKDLTNNKFERALEQVTEEKKPRKNRKEKVDLETIDTTMKPSGKKIPIKTLPIGSEFTFLDRMRKGRLVILTQSCAIVDEYQHTEGHGEFETFIPRKTVTISLETPVELLKRSRQKHDKID